MERGEALRELTAFVADCNNPLGRVPVTRAMRKHLAVFNKLRDAGLTWDAIAALLQDAGMEKSSQTWRRLYARAIDEE